MAGVAALFISHNGKIDPIALRSILQSTAVPIETAAGSGNLNTVAQQGAGLVDAFAACVAFSLSEIESLSAERSVSCSVLPRAFVTPGEISLNDTAHLAGPTTIKINNLGTSSKSYRISNKPAQAALTFGAVSMLGSACPPRPWLIVVSSRTAFSRTLVPLNSSPAPRPSPSARPSSRSRAANQPRSSLPSSRRPRSTPRTSLCIR